VKVLARYAIKTLTKLRRCELNEWVVADFLRLGLSRSVSLLYVVPGLLWFLKVRLLLALDNVQAAGEVSSSQNIEATLDLFFGVLVRNAAERHMLETLLFREAFLASMVFKLVFCLVPDLFSFVSCVFLNQSLLVVHLHVYWVVHQTFPNQLLRSISKLTSKQSKAAFCSSLCRGS